MNYTVLITMSKQADIFFHPVNPLIVREQLRQTRFRPNFGPRQSMVGAL